MSFGHTILIILCLLLSNEVYSGFIQGLDDIAEKAIRQIIETEQDNILSKYVEEFEPLLLGIQSVRELIAPSPRETPEVLDTFDMIGSSGICNVCQNIVNNVRNTIKVITDAKFIKEMGEKAIDLICDQQPSKRVCLATIGLFAGGLFKQLFNKDFNAYHACENVRLCPKERHRDFLKEYIKDVLKDKPANDIPTPSKKSTYKLLHLTDPHIDLAYQEGSNAFCDEPLCCRAENGVPSDSSQAAQYWGTKANCDIPLRTFEQFLQFTANNLDIDMILWTGDNIAHDNWNQTKNTQTINTYDATEDLLKYFPNTQIYPMFGNHDIYPADQFDVVGNSSAWLTSELGDMWKVWLDDEALESFTENSYYAIVNPKYNLKVIVLDTIVCDSVDFYIIEDPTDPMNQLAWLRQELYDSENKNQSVFIMSHIPPGVFNCDSSWSARYTALVDRFANIIRGQFFGHTHHDEFEIVRSYSDDTPAGVVFITPSLTSMGGLYPSFRVFEIDAETNQPINYYQYRLDLEKWNQNLTGPIEWDLAYDALSEYNLPDMSFQAFDNLTENIKNDTKVAETYIFNYLSGGTQINNLKTREIEHYYCWAKHSVAEEVLKCLGLDTNLVDVIKFAAEFMPGKWYFDQC